MIRTILAMVANRGLELVQTDVNIHMILAVLAKLGFELVQTDVKIAFLGR